MANATDALEAQIAALEAELSKDVRYRSLITLRGVLSDLKPSPPMVTLPPGHKVVPMTKEERVRVEVTEFLKAHGNRAHRKELASKMVDLEFLAEDTAVDNLSVYLSRWEEFESDGRGFVVLRQPVMRR
jgi:hypothetical protein